MSATLTRPAPVFWTQNVHEASDHLRSLTRQLPWSPHDRELVEQALEVLVASHGAQQRKGTGAPYAVHPIRVACLLVEELGVYDSTFVCAALLHDALEDTKAVEGDLRATFGDACIDLVKIVTRGTGEGRPPNGEGLEGSYLQRVQRAGDAAARLKTADKIDNMRDAKYLPDRERVDVYLDEVRAAYLPIARGIGGTHARRAERLLLEAALDATPLAQASALASMADTVRSRVNSAAFAGRSIDLDEIPRPGVAADIYNLLNPGAAVWIEYDGLSLTATKLHPADLARKTAATLRQRIASEGLHELLEIAGVPRTFAEKASMSLWKPVIAQLQLLERWILRGGPEWFDVLMRPDAQPALLSLIQSRVYFPVTRRGHLWSADLGSVLARRILELSDEHSYSLVALALGERLALSRYVTGTGTHERASRVFRLVRSGSHTPDMLWALRIAAEHLDAETDEDASHTTGLLAGEWSSVRRQQFEIANLGRGNAIFDALGGRPTAHVDKVEVVGLEGMRRLFDSVGHLDQLSAMLRLMIDRSDDNHLHWISFDVPEWTKRKKHWTVTGALAISDTALFEAFEAAGGRAITTGDANNNVTVVLPARRFALMDRLPELSAEAVAYAEAGGFTATSIFDAVFCHPQSGFEWWTPRQYRALDTLEDLDPGGVQRITVSFEASEPMAPLIAYLPLPRDEQSAKTQPDRKRIIARYLIAQIYSCGVTRRLDGATATCSAVTDQLAAHAFTDTELLSLMHDEERTSGLRALQGEYLERYAFDAFRVSPADSKLAEWNFGVMEMREGTYIGFDIGGTEIKCAVFRNGEIVTGTPLAALKTPKGLEVDAFCDCLLERASEELRNAGVRWNELHGIGIGWPGAVRGGRIVGASGVLTGLLDEGQAFGPNDPMGRLANFDFVQRVSAAVERAHGTAAASKIVIALINDGDAEALGNHSLRELNNLSSAGGKLVVKLGTSLAGGRITASGSVAEDVAEFSKISLKLVGPRVDASPSWVAKQYVSAFAVHALSRSFQFGDTLLIGDRAGDNDHIDKPRRVRPHELGELLPLFPEGAYASLLDQLVERDNMLSEAEASDHISATSQALRTNAHAILSSYVARRGNAGECEGRRAGETPGFASGLTRAIWLCTGQTPRIDPESETLADLLSDFPYESMARLVVGSVCLFSQVALHAAHLIAQLYNIYRRDTFNEILLSGGVLRGKTGDLVERQVRAFLLKYYDKVYGDGKSLARDGVLLVRLPGVSNPGVFGAAMSARTKRFRSDVASMRRRFDVFASTWSLGEERSVDEIATAIGNPAPRYTRHLIEDNIDRGTIVWTSARTLQRI